MGKTLGSVAEIAGGAGLAALSFVPGAQAFAPFLLSAGLSLGAMGASGLLAKSAKDKKQQESFKQPGPIAFETDGVAVGARFYTYGRTRSGGVFAFRESNGAYLGYGIILNCRPIDAVEAFFVDDELMQTSFGYPVGMGGVNGDGSPGFTTVDFGSGVQWPYAGLKYTYFYTTITFYNYSTKQFQTTTVIVGSGPCGFLEFRNAADAGYNSKVLFNQFSSLWDASHKAQGLAMLYSIWYGFGATDRAYHYPRLFPTHSTAFRGARVYDPRDLTQSFLDPVSGQYSVYNSTWKYSVNPALVIADFLTFPGAFGLAPSDINWPSIIQAANDCDRVVATYGGGVEAFAQVHLTWSADQERREVLGKLLAACDGVLWEDANGLATLWIAQWIDPTVTFGPEDISAIVDEEMNDVYDDINHVTATYVEPRTNFSKNSALFVSDSGSIALVGERKSTMDFDAVQSFNQAYRLTSRSLARHNTPSKLTVRGGPRLLLADTQKVVGINLPLYGVVGTYRPTAPVVASDLANIGLTLAKVTPEMFGDAVPPFDPVNQMLPGVAVAATFSPITPNPPTLVATITGLSAVIAGAVTAPNAMAAGSGTAAQLADTSSNASFRYRPVDPSAHTPLGAGAWTVWSSYLGQYAAVSPTITGTSGSTQTFEVQAWFITPTGTPGLYSASSFVDATFP